MKINYFEHPIPYFIIDDFFTEEEYHNVWNEIMFLAPKMRTPDQTAAARSESSGFFKRGVGVFIEEFYRKPNDSYIFHAAKRILNDEVIQSLETHHILYAPFKAINSMATMVQMYRNGDYYLSHRDLSLYTVVTLLHKEPKQYNGGEFKFSCSHLPIPLENNQTLIFPSVIDHEVTEVKMLSNKIEDSRFTITNLITISPH